MNGTGAIAEYNRLIAKDPAVAVEQDARLASDFMAAGITFDAAPMRSFLRPDLVERGAWDRLRRDGRRLLELAERVARQAFDADPRRLASFLGMPEAEIPWVVHDRGEPDVLLSRLDAFLTPEGPRFIEINSDAPAGFGYGDRMAQLFSETPFFREFAERVPIRYIPSGPPLVEAVSQAWRSRGGRSPASVAIVDWSDVKTRADQDILRESFERAGMTAVLADPGELDLSGARLFARSVPVDVVYRRALLPELLERRSEARTLLLAYETGAALFVNSFRCRLSEDKAFFGILSDEAFATLLTPEECALAARVLPWTRKLEERRTLVNGQEVDLLPFVLQNRERLVLKPAHGHGGQSVLVGSETDPRAWESCVADSAGQPWVVQERVPIPEQPFPVCDGGRLEFEMLKVNVNPFYVKGADVGAVARASRASVINVSAGGGSVPTFVVG